MQKLSRAELKMWMSTDGVMGDPDGFGKRQDPFSAVASVIAGTASTATVIAAVGEVGLAIGAVGAVTGSKDLMRVGGVMGIASGIGSLANSAFGAAEAASSGIASSAADSIGSDWASGAIDSVGSDWASGAADAMSAGSFADSATLPLDQIKDSAFDVGSSVKTAGESGALDSTQVGQDVSGNQISGSSATDQPSFSDAKYNVESGIDPSWTTTGYPQEAVAGGSFFSGLTDKLGDYLKTDRGIDTSLKLGGQLLTGIGNSYAATRKNQLDQQMLGLKRQQQDRGNEQVRVAGIINQARA